MNSKRIISITLFTGLLVFLLVKTVRKEQPAPFQYNEGEIFKTTYHIKYQYTEDLQTAIDAELNKFDLSLSGFNPKSIVSRINNNDPAVIPDDWFKTVFREAMKVSEATDGAFDITVAPLVNAWGFGFRKSKGVTPQIIDSLRQLVGYKRVRLVNGRVIKDDPRILLDCASLSDGFASDVIAKLFNRKGIRNYMIEIGGEIILKGKNSNGKIWTIGVDKPIDNPAPTSSDLQEKVALTDAALSTSGNYRNFYYKGGKKYAHTIDPETGYPVRHNLLSATIVAPTCIEADAYSTACMVIGLEKSLKLVEKHPGLEGYFIYSDKKGNMAVAYSKGFEKLIVR